jgi:glycosyltransferase involved in cell wall biosynthesis
MRIAWVTPFHGHSAIGEFSQHVTAELAKLADVEIWTSDDAPLLSTDLPLVGYSRGSKDLDELRYRDIIVYNMGNYLGYHGDIHAVSQEHPGVVILHDRALHHLFADMWLMGEDPDPVHYIKRMGAHYGAAGIDVASESLRGNRKPVWESDEDLLRFPLYEESITNALGVVTHSKGQARDVAAGWLGPVAALKLPCYSDILASANVSERPRSGERLRLLTMGHVNPNKQVHRVIGLLAADPELAARVEYRVVGPSGGFTAYSETLQRLIAHNADHLKVEILDWLPDSELEREMELVDVFVNLRHPNIEGGSASLMKQLAYGRPVLCFDSGCFGEMPQGTVVSVPTGDFEAASEALHDLVSNADRRKEVGSKARAFAESCNERSYAEGLMRLIEQARSAAPALRLLDSLSRELGDMHVDGSLPIFHDIAHDFARILDL